MKERESWSAFSPDIGTPGINEENRNRRLLEPGKNQKKNVAANIDPVLGYRNPHQQRPPGTTHDVSTTQPKRAVTLRTSHPHYLAGLAESSTHSSELSTLKNPSYPLQNLKRDPFRVRTHMLKGKAGPLCPITRHSEGTKGTDFATGKPRNRESGGLVERGRHPAPVIGPMPTGPIDNRPVTKRLLPSMLATSNTPVSDSPSFSARFYLTSRDVASNYRHPAITTIPTVPASLSQNASTIRNPGISQQDSTRWTRSRAQERKTTLLESRTSGCRASKIAHFDSGSTDGASQCMFPSSGILTTSESDIRVINTEEAHGLAQTTTQDLTRCARSHAQKLTTPLLKLGKAVRVPDETKLSLMKNRFGQRASQATRFDWGIAPYSRCYNFRPVFPCGFPYADLVVKFSPSNDLDLTDGGESVINDEPFDHGYAEWIESQQNNNSPLEESGRVRAGSSVFVTKRIGT
ncbi:uncharacterized protein EV420DRAFT_1474904 [Desarmillaria tabescens]|uniref:Uncharacterized protein n=1 Tax=Armillaria tabescens TaxID=1929756 RepID=A0AA39NIJ4_ARMTA|nr:uncharacterized protein EV420DRAFT_1474904 [Desarmillaria tabescens]KAK0466103.1 hypothetical protein EV420DRAFT_1474904 [Desarmillaria tabescens]